MDRLRRPSREHGVVQRSCERSVDHAQVLGVKDVVRVGQLLLLHAALLGVRPVCPELVLAVRAQGQGHAREHGRLLELFLDPRVLVRGDIQREIATRRGSADSLLGCCGACRLEDGAEAVSSFQHVDVALRRRVRPLEHGLLESGPCLWRAVKLDLCRRRFQGPHLPAATARCRERPFLPTEVGGPWNRVRAQARHTQR